MATTYSLPMMTTDVQPVILFRALVLWMAYIIVNNNIYKIVYKNELHIKYCGITALLYVKLSGDGSGMSFFSAAWP